LYVYPDVFSPGASHFWMIVHRVRLQNGVDFRSLSATHQPAGYYWCEALRGDKDAPIPEIKTR